jgi:hypothetical protein
MELDVLLNRHGLFMCALGVIRDEVTTSQLYGARKYRYGLLSGLPAAAIAAALLHTGYEEVTHCSQWCVDP